MSIIDFDNLKVTTMTVIVKLEGNVIIENVFPLLTITRLNLPSPIRHTKKFKIPYCQVPGAILSAKFKNITRGIVKSKDKKSFLNSVTVDICTSEKNINAKLSGNKIHMCGPNSEELAIETANHLIKHLTTLQNDLDYINNNIQNRDKNIEWLKNETKGQEYVVDSETQEIIKLDSNDIIKDDCIIRNGIALKKEKDILFEKWNTGDHVNDNNVICDVNQEPYILINKNGKKEQAILNTNFFVKVEHLDNALSYKFQDVSGNPIYISKQDIIKVTKVNNIEIPKSYPDKYSDDVDSRIVNFYVKYASDFAYHHVFCQFLDGVKNITDVITKNLKIDSVDMAMINYSYSLGMSVDRWALVNSINGKNGFSARYCNSTDHSVTISLPYEVDQTSDTVRRKNKPPRHTFMVHKSGIVTQSGPNIDLMRGAYYRFMMTIVQIRSQIIQKDQPFNLKYIPKYKTEEGEWQKRDQIIIHA